MHTREWIAGAGIGAALAFMLDPNTERRRRALVRDKAVRLAGKTRDGVDATARDVAHRARGIAAAARGRLSREGVDDARLVERVRARLGRVCSHPRAIHVQAENGAVRVSGPIRAHEANDVLAAVAAVRGVDSVSDELERHEDSARIPSLQGEGRVAGSGLDLLQSNWAPATRALVGAGLLATGVAIAVYARRGAQAA